MQHRRSSMHAETMAGLALFYKVTLCVLLLSLEVKGLDQGGNDFYVTFLAFIPSSQGKGKLYITTPEQFPVTFTISAPGTGYFHRDTVNPGGVKEFTFIGEDYVLRNTADRSKGIVITVENEKQVFVYAAQVSQHSVDSFLALPPHDLGTDSYTYIAAMIHTRNITGHGRKIHSLVGIVSVENDTLITITPTHDITIGGESVEAGDSIDFTLHRAETLLIALVGDLTGTKVTSTRPISFFSGDQCPRIPRGVSACDQIVEQLPPVEAWGRQFITAPLKTRKRYDMFRIVAASNDTMVNITCTHSSGRQGYVGVFALNEGGFTDVQVSSTEFCWMEADKSILLLQFAVGQNVDNVHGDPFMALVPAVNHYTSSLTLPIVNSALNDFTHYLNIIIPAEHYQPDQIFLDGRSLQSRALEFVAIVLNGETMAYASRVTVSATTHTLIHRNSTGRIGVMSYGFDHGASYGHIGGIRLPQFKPLTTPTELTVLEITSTSFTISWRPPQGDPEDVSAIYYLINVTDMERKNVVFHNVVSSTIPILNVAELLPDHVYQVTVAAVSGERVGPSLTLFVKTIPVPTLPTELTVLEITSTGFTISWKPPQGDLEDESNIYYLINVTDMERKNVVFHHVVNSTILNLNVPELLPDHVHQVTVAAVSGERGSPSLTLFVKTIPVASNATITTHATNTPSDATSSPSDANSTPGDATSTATDCNSILITVIMGSLIGLLLLILIAAVILGTCICICLHVCIRHRKQGDAEIATYDTVTSDGIHLDKNPAYESLHLYQKPKPKVRQK